MITTRTHTTSRPPRHPARRTGLVVCAAALTLAATACTSTDSPPAAGPNAQAPKSTISGLPAIDPLPCDPASAAPGETVTRDRGTHASPISIVADYHWSIITARDTARAADAIAPRAAMGSPQLLAAALNGYPPGTTYCLRLRQTAPTVVLFTLSYKPPFGPAGEYRLRADVTGAPGDVRVAGEVDQ